MNRRDFLKAGLIAGAGAVAASRAQAQQPAGPKSKDEINIALVGAGTEGRVLLNAMLSMNEDRQKANLPGRVRFKAVCDIWEYSRQYGQRYLKKYNHDANAYEDYREMLAKEKDLQAVVVATPDFVHHEISNAAMKAGLHVYCEKMMSNEIEKARSMVKTMKETGKLCQIGHQRRSNPRYLHVREQLIKKAKLCGRITNANGQWNRSVTDDFGWPQKYTIEDGLLKKWGYDNMHEFRNWRWFKKYGGGPISDLGAHQIDIFNWFLDVKPKSVIAGGGVDFYQKHEWYDNTMAIFEHVTPEGPVRSFYQVLTTTGAGGYFEQFMGTEGTIRISENPKFTKIYREVRSPEWDEFIKQNLIVKSEAPVAKSAAGKVDVRESAELQTFDIPIVLDKPLHQLHLENFFDTVCGKAKLNCPADEAFQSEVAVLKVNEAVAAQKMIVFKPEDFAC